MKRTWRVFRAPVRAVLALLASALLVALPSAVDAKVPDAIRIVDGGASRIPLMPRTVLVDPAGDIDAAEANRRLSAPDAEVQREIHSRGYTADTVWARMVLDIAPRAAGLWYLTLELPSFDRLQVYRVPSAAADPGGGTPVPLFAIGDRVPPVHHIASRFHLAPLTLKPGRHVLLVRGETSGTMTLALTLRKLAPLLIEERSFLAAQAFYLGICAVLFLAVLGLFAFTRHAIYPIYGLCLIAYCGAWMTINGMGPDSFWPGLAVHFRFQTHAFNALLICGTFAFAAVFLSTSRVPRWTRTLLWSISALGAVLTLLCFIAPDRYVLWMNRLVSQFVLPSVGLFVVPILIGLLRGEPAARPLMLSWLGLLFAISLGTLRDQGFLPNTVFTLSGPQFGSLFEMAIFAYMLINRLGRLQREKEQMQQAALTAAREQEAVLERRVAERTAELDAANGRLRTIVRSGPFPNVLVREADDRFLFINQRARDLIGLSAEAQINSVSRDWIVDQEAHAALLADLAEQGVADGREIELFRSDGSTFWALLSAVRLVYDGEPARLVALSDITRIKSLERNLRQTAQKEAAAAQREREARQLQRQFVAMVSHEFRTPLAIIDGAAQNVAARDERDRGRLQKIRASVRRLLRMIDSCLVDERIEAGAMGLDVETVDLREVVAEAVDAMGAAVSEKRFSTELPATPVPILADAGLVEIALNNLLENAVKYTPSESHVSVALRVGEDSVELSVSDQGPGIPPEERGRIFDKFYRASNSAVTAGAGLGLYLVREIMTAHGGSAAYQPACGGARFLLRFPGDRRVGQELSESEAAE